MRKRFGSFSKECSGATALQMSLIFAAVAVAAGLLGSPLASSLTSGAKQQFASNPGIDATVTGAIQKQPEKRRYTVRRSVLQKNPNTGCKIYRDGRREGDC